MDPKKAHDEYLRRRKAELGDFATFQQVYEQRRQSTQREAPSELILCVYVQFADGRRAWVPKTEYDRAPDRGSFVITDHGRPRRPA